MKCRLEGYLEAMAGVINAMKETQNAAGEELQKAVDEWATTAEKKAVEYLDRPNWLLSRSISNIVRKYERSGKIWGMAGIIKDGTGNRDPSFYVRFHESGWRKGGGKPSAPKKFLTRAKMSAAPKLEEVIKQANNTVKATFEEEIRKIRAK